MATYKVKPRPKQSSKGGRPDEWVVKKHGNKQATEVTNAKNEAVQAAKRYVGREDRLVIQNADGSKSREITGTRLSRQNRSLRGGL